MKSQNALALLDTYLGSAIAGSIGLGGGALIHNAVSQPTYLTDNKGRVIVGEDGNPVIANENDINPFLAAGVGAGLGTGMKYTHDTANRVLANYAVGRKQPEVQQAWVEDPW